MGKKTLHNISEFLNNIECRSSLFWDKVNIKYGTPLQYSCLENAMDGGA